MSDGTESIGRNESCPCGSGKKYKRCHGVGAPPKLSVPKIPEEQRELLESYNAMDPAVRKEMMQAFRSMPKDQLRKLQSISQRMLNGESLEAELAEIQNLLPADFQQKMMGLSGPVPEMSEEEARALVAQAAAEGKISPDQAAKLLKDDGEKQAASETPPADKKSGGFFKGLLGGKNEKS